MSKTFRTMTGAIINIAQISMLERGMANSPYSGAGAPPEPALYCVLSTSMQNKTQGGSTSSVLLAVGVEEVERVEKVLVEAIEAL